MPIFLLLARYDPSLVRTSV